MLRKLRARLTYANIVSTIALVAAVGGGTAYAAAKIGTDNIRTTRSPARSSPRTRSARRRSRTSRCPAPTSATARSRRAT